MLIRSDRPERLQRFPRLTGENFWTNRKLVEEVEKIAEGKGATVSQVALGWILAIQGKNGLPRIIPIPGSTTEDRIKENTSPAKLTEEDVAAIDAILKSFPSAGLRYPEAGMHHTNG